MGKSHYLITLFAQSVLDFFACRTFPNRTCYLINLATISLKDSTHSVAKIASINQKGPITRFDQIGHCQVHPKRSRACNNKGLAIRSQPHFAHPFQGLPEFFGKIRCHMARCWPSHSLKNIRIEIDWAGYHKQCSTTHLDLSFPYRANSLPFV